MKLFNYKKHKLSKKFLIAASAYRREVLEIGVDNLDFSLYALQEQYRHETYGTKRPDAKTNGYTYGKSILGITIAAMEEDISSGLFVKYEFRGTPAFKRKLISKIVVGQPFFGYD